MRQGRIVFAALLVLAVAESATHAAPNAFSHSGLAPGTSVTTPSAKVLGAASISQSTNQTTVVAGSVSCNGGTPGFFHTDNSYYRGFTLTAFNPPLDQLQFKVESVRIGIETANAAGTGTTQPITLNIYNSTANPPLNATVGAVLSTETVNVADQTLSLLTVPLTTQPVFTVASGILVVEVFTPSGQVAGHSFFMGSNALGQSGPSFIKAALCGLSDIGNLASIGFPNMHIVMTVNGNSQVPVELQSINVD